MTSLIKSVPQREIEGKKQEASCLALIAGPIGELMFP